MWHIIIIIIRLIRMWLTFVFYFLLVQIFFDVINNLIGG